jgi:hypothetical protein
MSRYASIATYLCSVANGAALLAGPAGGQYYRFCSVAGGSVNLLVEVDVIEGTTASFSLKIKSQIINGILAADKQVAEEYYEITCPFQYVLASSNGATSLVIDTEGNDCMRTLREKVPILPNPLNLKYVEGEHPTISIFIGGADTVLRSMDKSVPLANTDVDSDSDSDDD